MANITKYKGTPISKLTGEELSAYIDECAEKLREINDKAIAAGRKTVPFPEPRIAAINYELVPIGGGKFAVQKRKRALIDDLSSLDADVSTQVTTSATSGFNKSFRRGRYKDAADRLIDEDAASVELGEVQSTALNS